MGVTTGWHARCSFLGRAGLEAPEEGVMYNIFYVIGVVVVVLFILGYLGFR